MSHNFYISIVSERYTPRFPDSGVEQEKESWDTEFWRQRHLYGTLSVFNRLALFSEISSVHNLFTLRTARIRGFGTCRNFRITIEKVAEIYFLCQYVISWTFDVKEFLRHFKRFQQAGTFYWDQFSAQSFHIIGSRNPRFWSILRFANYDCRSYRNSFSMTMCHFINFGRQVIGPS